MCIFMFFQIKLEETIIHNDLIRTLKLTVLSEKTLVDLLRNRPSDQHRHILGSLVADAFDKRVDAKKLLILQKTLDGMLSSV